MKGVRRRYLALQLDCEGAVDSQEFMNAVWSAVLKLFGEYGASKTGLVLIDFDVERRFAIVRVANAAVDTVRAAIASITNIGNRQVAVHVVMVSGTLKALRRKMGNSF